MMDSFHRDDPTGRDDLSRFGGSAVAALRRAKSDVFNDFDL